MSVLQRLLAFHNERPFKFQQCLVVFIALGSYLITTLSPSVQGESEILRGSAKLLASALTVVILIVLASRIPVRAFDSIFFFTSPFASNKTALHGYLLIILGDLYYTLLWLPVCIGAWLVASSEESPVVIAGYMLIVFGINYFASIAWGNSLDASSRGVTLCKEATDQC